MKDMEKKEALVASGELPNDIHIYDRFAYIGHEVVYGFWQPPEEKKYRCVACKHDWTGTTPDGSCPGCFQLEGVYQLNYDRTSLWRCVKCKHEWRGEKGWECPSCGALENPPRWTCKKCSHQFISEDSQWNKPCPSCGEVFNP